MKTKTREMRVEGGKEERKSGNMERRSRRRRVEVCGALNSPGEGNSRRKRNGRRDGDGADRIVNTTPTIVNCQLSNMMYSGEINSGLRVDASTKADRIYPHRGSRLPNRVPLACASPNSTRVGKSNQIKQLRIGRVK